MTKYKISLCEKLHDFERVNAIEPSPFLNAVVHDLKFARLCKACMMEYNQIMSWLISMAR